MFVQACGASAASRNKKRLPSLVDVHGDDLNWARYDAHNAKFVEWMTSPINADRTCGHYDPDGGGLKKVQFAVSSVLTHLAVRHDWGSTPSFDWLLHPKEFDTIFTSYAEYLSDERENDGKYIAKQLSELRHAVEWGGTHKWRWGYLYTHFKDEIISKLTTLQSQYYQQGSKRKQTHTEVEAACGSRDQEVVTLETYYKHVATVEADLLELFANAEASAISDAAKLKIAECLMLKLVRRGGRTVDLHQLRLSASEATAGAWISADEQWDDKLTFVVGGGDAPWELLLLSSKKHFIASSLDDTAALLELYVKCFPRVQYEESFMFTPTMHGVRHSRSPNQHSFPTAAKFADYFEGLTRSEFCIEKGIRPYEMRRLQAKNLQRNNATKEVRDSHASLLGTSVANLEGAYDRRSAHEQSFLATQVQTYQFHPAFSPTEQNKVAPALLPNGTGVSLGFTLARLIREATLPTFVPDNSVVCCASMHDP